MLDMINVPTLIIALIVIVAVVFAIIYIVKHRSIGKCSGCSGDCSKCHIDDRQS